MPRDDDYFDDDGADDAFAAAIEAAERRSQPSASSTSRPVAPQTPKTNAANTIGASSSGPVKQLAPQKISRPISTSSIIVNTRQVYF